MGFRDEYVKPLRRHEANGRIWYSPLADGDLETPDRYHLIMAYIPGQRHNSSSLRSERVKGGDLKADVHSDWRKDGARKGAEGICDASSQHNPWAADGRKLLSIVMPAMNEEGNLPRAYDEISRVMADLTYDYEVLVIDNASTDGTGALGSELAGRDSRWRYVRFSRNFSVEISIAAGLRFAARRCGLGSLQRFARPGNSYT